MTFSEIKNALSKQTFFAGKTWKFSPDPWVFSSEQRVQLSMLGGAILAFYRALEKLYIASAQGKKILRNEEFYAPWVATLLDFGKPSRLVAHQRSRALAGTIPPIIRPDLLLCAEGFALTELDSVPGGIGLTAFLSQLYSCGDSMPELFLSAIGGTTASNCYVVIAVSDEARDYRPEFEWLVEKLRCRGVTLDICHPNALEISSEGVFFKRKKVDILYRFFELFDLGNVQSVDVLFDVVERGAVSVVPPMRPFQEEKSSLALLHHPTLFRFWEETLGIDNFLLLKKNVPETWLVESLPEGGLPASSVLHAPFCKGRPIRDWQELTSATRRDRELVLKASGFDETAWGARSVTIGIDTSQSEWKSAIESALHVIKTKRIHYVLQRFRKPEKLLHSVFDENGISVPAFGRVRICPYYFVVREGVEREEAVLGGALCTFCPPDKKIIHGMSNAVLLPCVL